MSVTPIVDAHLHLWDPKRIHYPWLDSVPVLNRAFLLDDYNRATEGFRIERMVFVQCEAVFSEYMREVKWLTQLARADPRIAAVVSWAPLENGSAARRDLETLAANPLVKGVRRIIQFESDPGFCLRPAFIDGVQLLAEFNFSFDICIKGEQQTANVIELVRRCPEVRFMLDHIGKPFIADRRMEPWKTHIRELASMDNVWCKMSGLVVEADVLNWKKDDLRPYIDHVLACFGAARVVFGGDWPVVLQAAPLARWITTLSDALDGCSPQERRRIFHDNAIKFYQLN